MNLLSHNFSRNHLGIKFSIPVLLFCLLFISTIHRIDGQTAKGIISGNISDTTGASLAYASLQLEGTSLGTTTNSSGDFILKNIEPGRYKLIISVVGYQKQMMKIEVEPLKTTRLSITLKEDTKKLKEVVLTSRTSYKKDIPSNSLRLTKPLMEVPQNIVVVGKGLIQDQQLLTLAEVERNVSGVTTNFPYPGVYTDFMIRGSRAEANKFRNGIQSAYGTQLMEDMSFVESVEFVKGPAGFMISQGEPGGIYNVVTKKPTRNELREISLTYGSFNLFRGALDVGGSFKENGKLLYRLNGMAQQSRTHIDYDYNNRYALAPVISYELSDNTKLTAEYNFQKAFIGVVEPSVFTQGNYRSLPVNFTYFDPSGEGVKITDHTAYLNLEHKFNADWKLSAQMGYSHGRWYGNRFDFDFGPTGILDSAGNMYRAYELRDVTSKSTSGQVFVNGKIKTGALQHSLLMGLDASNNSLSRFDASESVPYINIYKPEYTLTEEALPNLNFEGASPYKESTNYSAIYVQDEISLFDDLRITLAGRYTSANILTFEDQSSIEHVAAFSPRAGLSYSIKPSLSVYALYDQSFIPQSGQTPTNEKVNPQRGNNLEAGIKKEWFNRALSTNLAVYQITKTNKLVSVIGTDYVVPLGEIQSKGLEFDMMGKVTKDISLVFNYAYTDSRITEDTDETIQGQRVDGVAKHATNLWLKYGFSNTILKGLEIGIGGRYLADRAALTTYYDVEENKFPELDDWKQLDASLSYRLDNFRFSFNVNNITNEKNYVGVPVMDIFYTQYSPPTHYRLSTTLQF